MVRKLIELSVANPLVVVLLALALFGIGMLAFLNINVEAYPDPAPAIIEVVAQYPGASAEEVERLVTIPLEATLAGMPGLNITRSKSLFGLSHLRNQFHYGVDFEKARQEVINRLQFVENLPAGITAQLSPQSPTGEIYRYTLASPKNALGQDVYSLSDLKALQDWMLRRQFKRIPGGYIIDVSAMGGTVKRYEIHPDPYRLKQKGITLQQLQNAIASSSGNVGGDYLRQGSIAEVVRSLGVIGNGRDPMDKAFAMKSPGQAATYLRDMEQRRLRDLRKIVIASVDGVAVRVDDVVAGGPVVSDADLGREGVVVSNQTRLGQVSMSRPLDPQGRDWRYDPEKVQGIVLMHRNRESLPAIYAVKAKVEELNKPGRMLPGVQIESYYDRADLVNVTTRTVRHNLIMGMVLVVMVLLMFLSNVRSALIVAINIPLALLVAFTVLYTRGKSANLLSIGAVDFGIIVDSSVIVVENIYRHLSSGDYIRLPLKERIIRASHEVERSLFFSTAIMVCAFIPLFTMQGPEGQIFGPMADTYAFALGGALLLALSIAPVLCCLLLGRLDLARHSLVMRALRAAFFATVAAAAPVLLVLTFPALEERVVEHLAEPALLATAAAVMAALWLGLFWFFVVRQPDAGEDNALVRFLKRGYLRQLERCLNHRWLTLGIFAALTVATLAFGVPHLGREFMPELEEGNLWVRANLPTNVSLQEASQRSAEAQAVMREYPEVRTIVAQVGRPDDGTDPTGFNMIQFFAPLRPQQEWPVPPGRSRRRTKAELVDEMNAELQRKFVGVDWNFSQYIRDNVMEALSGVQGDNSVKIIGPDLVELEKLAEKVRNRLEHVRGIGSNVGIFRIMGQSNVEVRVDPDKCKRWGISVADVNNVIDTAVRGKAFTQMIEGEKLFDITLRWPENLRQDLNSILDIPVDVSNNQVTTGPPVPSAPQTRFSGASSGPSASGTSATMPAQAGSVNNAPFLSSMPRVPLRELVTPVGDDGLPDPKGHFVRPGVSIIFREQGNRLIALKFSVRGRDLASAVAEAQQKTADLFKGQYRAEWGGEFEEMQVAEHRLMWIIPLSLGLIFILLYMAFRSFLDALVVLSNVVALSLGGVWALLLTNTNFSISAAVGFVSIFGVAIMDGLLAVSYFNQLRLHGHPLREAIMVGAEKRVRPIMMTALTAIFGLLPAALATDIGSQTQQPLAIVVVGGMISTLFLTRYLMPVLYSFYGQREPNAAAASMAH